MKVSRARWWRHRGLPVVAGSVCTVAAVLSVGPTSAAGPLFSYDLIGGARGYSMFYDAPGQGRAGEATVPEASSSLTTGNIGYGLASMAWPGPLLGNLGTLMVGLGAPPEARGLDWTVRAEARTPQDPPTTTNTSVPGTSMVATAKSDFVEGVGSVQRTANEAVNLGTTQTRSLSKLDGATGVVQSSALVQNIAIAGGVVKIDSVASTATASTDGTTSDGAGKTVVKGLTIAGMPAIIDDKGISIGGQNVPANAVVNQIAQQALSQAGIRLVLSAPSRDVKGETALVDSGALTVTWNAREGGTFGLIIGGARAAVTGSPSLDDLLGDIEASIGTDTFPTGDDTGVGENVLSAGGDFSDGGTSSLGATGGAGGDTGGPGVDVPIGGQRAAAVGGKPIKPGLAILALLGAGFFALAMRRLSDDVLSERAAVAACPLSGG